MSLNLEVFNFWGKDNKVKKHMGLCPGFFSICTQFVACTLQLVDFPLLKSLDPCLLKILDARLC